MQSQLKELWRPLRKVRGFGFIDLYTYNMRCRAQQSRLVNFVQCTSSMLPPDASALALFVKTRGMQGKQARALSTGPLFKPELHRKPEDLPYHGLVGEGGIYLQAPFRCASEEDGVAMVVVERHDLV